MTSPLVTNVVADRKVESNKMDPSVPVITDRVSLDEWNMVVEQKRTGNGGGPETGTSVGSSQQRIGWDTAAATSANKEE